MVDSVISVRMPSSLVQRLKELSKDNHFLDLSEEVRSIIKFKIKNYTEEIPEKSEEAQKPADFKTENIVKEEVVKRLKKIIKELEHD
jgi:metal-responsive CopG/Arc/MetJ family transcriptional regulator